jgi:hypothetical protein
MLAEERLDLAVEATRLGPGEPVIVITKMGKEVARGTVGESVPGGAISIMVKEQGEKGVEQARLYDPSLYSFIPEEPKAEGEPGEPFLDKAGNDEPLLTDLPLDARVEAKMKQRGISLVEQPAAAGPDETPGGGKRPAPANSAKQADNGQGPPPNKDKAPDPRADNREAGASVNIDALPEQLKKKIVGVKGLDESQRDKVLAEISDAALRSLKSVGVKDGDVYKTVVKIQEAVAPVLEQKG